MKGLGIALSVGLTLGEVKARLEEVIDGRAQSIQVQFSRFGFGEGGFHFAHRSLALRHAWILCTSVAFPFEKSEQQESQGWQRP